MKIYLDFIFIENFIVDAILLKEMSYISKCEIKTKNILISSLISSIYVAILLVFRIKVLDFLFCKLLLVGIMVYIAIMPEKLVIYIKNIVIFFLVNIVNLGAVVILKTMFRLDISKYNLKLAVYILGFLIARICITKLWKIYKTNIKKESLIYDVYISLDNKTYLYKGFLDTGNTVYSSEKCVPIIFAEYMDEEMKDRLASKESFNIRTVTLGRIAERKAYVLDNVKIKNKEMTYICRVGIAFQEEKISRNLDYNMVLNYTLYEEKMGGIRI